MPREILVDWTTPAGGGFRSVLFFAESESVADQRADLGAMLGSIDALFDDAVSWSIETSGREMDSASGTLTGVWSESTGYAGTGAVPGNPVPDVAQVLLRWNTNSIVNGRFLKGRTFLPGISTSSSLNGNVAASSVATMQTAVNTFVAALNGFGVWHRPVDGAGGSFATAQTGTVWTEYASLRRRRN